MDHARNTFWGWPGARNVAYAYLVLGPPSFAWFVLVYAGADYLTGLHQHRVALYFSWELAMPFVPATAPFYNSLHLAYAVAPFILRTRPEMHALAWVWFLMTLVGGIVFLAIPFEPGYPAPTAAELGVWQAMYAFADHANLRYNCCPSLHVAWGVACVDVYARHAGAIGKWLLRSWGAAMTLSTLLLHQHHLIDVAGGLLLAFWGSRAVYPRLLARFRQGEKPL